MAKINQDDLDDLRNNADIIQVVSGYTQLKRAGGQTFKGLCPFHSEKTPSFTVDAGKGLWHCFGCGEGGNVYQFIQRAENLPFVESVEWLARKTGFPLRYEETRPGEQQASGAKRALLDANRAAAEFFHHMLVTAPEADGARRYLSSRGFGREVAQRWMLGFAPGRDALCRHLRERGFTDVQIEQADLGRKSQRDGALYDTFRGRVTFPTWNLQGDVVGFGARALGDGQPKYLNTSETPVFSKSRVMYGLNRAKSAITRAAAIVVEGYTDVIALHEAGITEAVATNGVALAESHFEQLKKFTSRVVLMFDADAAGKGASERGFGLHHRLGIEVLVAPLPPGRDPADVVAHDGVEGIRKAIEAAQSLVEFKLEQTISRLPLDTPEARARAVRTAAEVLGWQPDPIARHEYAFVAAKRIGVDSEAVQRALSELRSGPGGSAADPSDRARERRLPGHVKVEREALRLLLRGTDQVSRWLDDIAESDFTSPARRELFRHASSAVTRGRAADARMADELSPDALSLFTELFIAVGDDHGSEPDERRMEEIFTRLAVFRLEREIKQRRDTLQEVNPLADANRHDELFTALVRLEAHRRDLLRRLQGDA